MNDFIEPNRIVGSLLLQNSTYSNRGLECPTCQNKFPSMTLEDLRIDMKVLMLQKMAGVHTFDTATPPTSGRLTNGDSKSTGGRNHLQGPSQNVTKYC